MDFSILSASLNGELFTDEKMRRIYATDASLYRELPIAVAFPKNEEDILQLVQFAKAHKIGLIPRTAGTSLAGQCVGQGIVVDTSHYLSQIVSIDAQNARVTVQPGVIRDELNRFLKPHGLFFGPNTSTANRAMIGGMVGNNSSGSYSLVYGVTRDHVEEIKGFLSNGEYVHFRTLTAAEFEAKCKGNSLESEIYRFTYQKLSQPEIQAEIHAHYPKKQIHRRNTGYAIDALLEMQPFTPEGKPFNMCKLISGSEGTLMMMTEITLHVDPLPPAKEILIAIHFDSLTTALQSVVTIMQFAPRAVELMDKTILDCTKANIEQNKNRFFLEGDAEAILMIEFGGETVEEVQQKADALIAELKKQQKGYAFPCLFPPQSHRAMELRKAGLGVLANLPGPARAIEFVEDTAVAVEDLADFIRDFDTIMKEKYAQKPVYYAHAGAGELHIRPTLDLKTPKGMQDFRGIAEDTATLVKQYQGALSGEHGDGRVRAEFIPQMVGEKNYALLKALKQTWDIDNIFNPGKIIDAPKIEEGLREAQQTQQVPIETLFDFGENGMFHMAEKCSGSADCRKLPTSGGTMCPSYMATRNEKDTTRARANILREYLSFSTQKNRLNHSEIYEVMDLCVSCKGCKSECPSNVDMATLKAEFLYQYYKDNGVPFAAKMMANIGRINRLGRKIPSLTNFVLQNTITGGWLKKMLKVAPERSLPTLSVQSFRDWFYQQYPSLIAQPTQPSKGSLYVFADEFTDCNEAELGKQVVTLWIKLGYEVRLSQVKESGRAHISKGLLAEAKEIAQYNYAVLNKEISASVPLVGIEPSAILTFRDEFLRLMPLELQSKAKVLSAATLTWEEFMAQEIQKGNISPADFTPLQKPMFVHGHCHQKALSDMKASQTVLGLVGEVNVIPSGCCGMAGSFGYEVNHYQVSMQMGELVLFPAIRTMPSEGIAVAAGTSCRHQILDGTQHKALHPITILFQQMK